MERKAYDPEIELGDDMIQVRSVRLEEYIYDLSVYDFK